MGLRDTVRGKILEGENFGEPHQNNQLARKKLADVPVVDRNFYTWANSHRPRAKRNGAVFIHYRSDGQGISCLPVDLVCCY